jgi:hypothetical protein
MTAIAWTLVGLLAATLGILATALFAAISRIDGVGATLGTRIDDMGATLGTRIDDMGATLGTRIDDMGAALHARIDSLGDDLRGEIRELRGVVHDLDVRLTRTDG